MKKLRSRLGLLAISLFTGYLFDVAIKHRPVGEYWDMAYFGSAATVDWFMYYVCQRFVSGKLCRDVEALCIASIVTNALGFALYMASQPPTIYNWMIAGINYVFAIRLLFMGRGDVFNYSDWRDMVRSVVGRRSYLAKEKTE